MIVSGHMGRLLVTWVLAASLATILLVEATSDATSSSQHKRSIVVLVHDEESDAASNESHRRRASNKVPVFQVDEFDSTFPDERHLEQQADFEILRHLQESFGSVSDPPSDAPSGIPDTNPGTIKADTLLLDLVANDPELDTFAAWLVTTGFDAELGSDDFVKTLFAPTTESLNAVFGEPQDLVDGLASSVMKLLGTVEYALHLENLLLYHITRGDIITSTDFSDGLLTVQANSEGNRFAFNDTVQEYILSGFEEWNILDSVIASADNTASNGVMHVLGTIPGTAEAGVLLPSFVFQVVAEPPTSDLYDYSTLMSLLEASGLTELLTSTFGPYMLLAPTNDAFAALSPGTVDSLMMPQNLEALRNTLSYHIILKTDFNEYYIYPTNLISEGLEIETLLAGKKVTVTSMGGDGTIVFNDATSVEQILCIDGVIYGIDAVLSTPP
jgi:uncharacterized surface protein with fasciclin (FAS1) repeats